MPHKTTNPCSYYTFYSSDLCIWYVSVFLIWNYFIIHILANTFTTASSSKLSTRTCLSFICINLLLLWPKFEFAKKCEGNKLCYLFAETRREWRWKGKWTTITFISIITHKYSINSNNAINIKRKYLAHTTYITTVNNNKPNISITWNTTKHICV